MCNENRRTPVQSPVRERHASRPINPSHTQSPLLAFQGLDVPLHLCCMLAPVLLSSVLPYYCLECVSQIRQALPSPLMTRATSALRS